MSSTALDDTDASSVNAVVGGVGGATTNRAGVDYEDDYDTDETERIFYCAPEALSSHDNDIKSLSLWKPVVTATMAGGTQAKNEAKDDGDEDSEANDDCPICLDTLLPSCEDSAIPVSVQLVVCGHVFHQDCILQALSKRSSCPTCRQPIREPQGYMPSGCMTIQRQPNLDCEGFTGAGSIVIEYDIDRAVQKSYHIHPGVQHGSAHRTAYVPDTFDGNLLLKRLKYAFLHGLTFTVGTSLASGKDNSVTWASIHHKTSTHGGVQSHGFPDPSFFVNCNEELDDLNVPEAVDL